MGEKPSTITHEDGTVETGYWSLEGQNVHKVMLDSFSIMKFEVTYGEYDFYTDYTGKELIQKRLLGLSLKDGNQTTRQALTGNRHVIFVTGLPK